VLDRLKRLDERGLLAPLLVSALLIACAGPPLAAAYLRRYYRISGKLRLLEVYVVERPLVCARGAPEHCLPPATEPVRLATELKARECTLPPAELLAVSVPTGAAYAVSVPRGLKLLAPVWEKVYWSSDPLSGRWEEVEWTVTGYAVIEAEGLAEEVQGPASYAYGAAGLRYRLSAAVEGPWPYAVRVYAYPAVNEVKIFRWQRPPCEGGVLATEAVRGEIGIFYWHVEVGRRPLSFELSFEYSGYNGSLVFTHRFAVNEPVAVRFSFKMVDWGAALPSAKYLKVYQCDESRLRYRAEYSEGGE